MKPIRMHESCGWKGAIAEESWFDDEVTPAAFKAELDLRQRPHYRLDQFAGRRLCGRSANLQYAHGLSGRCNRAHRRHCRQRGLGDRHGRNEGADVAGVRHDDSQSADRGHGRQRRNASGHPAAGRGEGEHHQRLRDQDRPFPRQAVPSYGRRNVDEREKGAGAGLLRRNPVSAGGGARAGGQLSRSLAGPSPIPCWTS